MWRLASVVETHTALAVEQLGIQMVLQASECGGRLRPP